MINVDAHAAQCRTAITIIVMPESPVTVDCQLGAYSIPLKKNTDSTHPTWCSTVWWRDGVLWKYVDDTFPNPPFSLLSRKSVLKFGSRGCGSLGVVRYIDI